MRAPLYASLALSLFTMTTASHAAPQQAAGAAWSAPAKRAVATTQSAAGRAKLPKLVSDSEDDFGGGVLHRKVYQMPSGREIKVDDYGLGDKTFKSPNYKVTEVEVGARDAGRSVTVRTVKDKARERETTQSYKVPAKRGTLIGIENMRSQRGDWTDVKRATYRDASGEKSVILTGTSQVEERAPLIDEAAIAKKYQDRQTRQADLEAAFGAKK